MKKKMETISTIVGYIVVVPITRVMVSRDQYWDPSPIYGNYHVGLSTSPDAG